MKKILLMMLSAMILCSSCVDEDMAPCKTPPCDCTDGNVNTDVDDWKDKDTDNDIIE
jgi:hypothetical protein